MTRIGHNEPPGRRSAANHEAIVCALRMQGPLLLTWRAR
jgi:hypothetical protein